MNMAEAVGIVGTDSVDPAPAAQAAAATTRSRTGMVASSGLGQLTKMLNDHMDQMKDKDEWVDNFLKSFASSTLLKDAKVKAVETETQILTKIMDDIMEMTAFLNNIILIENYFNKLYEPHKSEQEAARSKYAPNIAKYEDKPKVNSEVGSFVELMFGGQTVHSGSFQKWLDKVNAVCKEQNIKVKSNSGAHCKKIERAFYKAFYVYSSHDNDQGYKEMTDVIRCSIVFDSFDDLYRAYSVIEEIAEKDLTGGILRLKDRFHPELMPFGYRDLLINVYCPGSKIVCEMQLHHVLFYKVKKVSHRMYVKARLFEREGYNAAYDYATKYVRPRINDKCYEIKDTDVITEDYADAKSADKGASEEKEEEEIDFRVLLKKWKLDKYADIMEEEGWEDPIDWKELTEDDLKNDMNFSKGHIKKFQRKYAEWQEEYESKTKAKGVKKNVDNTQNNALLEAQRKLLEEQKRLEERQKQMMEEQERKYKAELEKLKASNVQQWEHKVFVFESDFDEHGIIYGLATEWGGLSWQNPALSGKLIMRASDIKSDSKPVSSLVGRQTVRFLCEESQNAWFSVDFLALRICPTYYSLRHYASWDIEALRYWDFEGSIDGVNWTTIKRHRNDAKLNQKGCAAGWSLNCQYYFGQFRVRMTGKNDNDHWYLACSGIEIYGSVKRGNAALNLPIPVPTEHKEEEVVISDPSAGKVFSYEKDFDTNGIIHWLGTNKGIEAFQNPVDRALVEVTSVKLVDKSVDVKNILDKNTVRIATDNIERGWISIDFGDVYIKPTKYTLKHYLSWDTEALRTWELHASNGCRPGVQPEFLIIKKHDNDTSLNRKGATKTWSIPPISTDEAFNKFRLVITGKNSNDQWYLSCSGFEIYGQVLNDTPSYVAPSKPLDLGKEMVFEHKSDFDENGLLYYLGSYANTKPWGNPRAAGIIHVSASSLGPESESIDSFVGRKAVRCLTKEVKNSDMMLDLKEVRLNVTRYTLRHYSSWDTEALREWNLEGSNDAVNWVVLKSHVNDAALNKKGVSATWEVHTKGWFRYFRIIITGPNDNNHYYLCCSGIEVYGTAVGGFVSNPPVHQKQEDPDPPHKVFKYSGKTFGDEGGLLYYLGTLNGTQKWGNPHSLGLCSVSASSIVADSESITHFCGRTAVRLVTKESERADMMIDLKEIRIKLTHYTLRHYSSWDTEALRNWDLEGSHDGKAWVTLKSHQGDISLHKKGQEVTWPVENVEEFFQFFRIILTGANSNNHLYLACSGIELYGVAAGGIIKKPITTEPPPPGPYRKFEYGSDFDANGIIYWLGTRGNTQEWSNPATMEAPLVSVQSSPLVPDSQPISAICGRSLVRCVSQDKVNAWWLLNFYKMRIRPTAYTLKHYSSWDTECLRDWKLEGKNADGKWKLISTHIKDESLKGKGGTATFHVETKEFFQQLSVMMTGKNSNNHWYLACSGVELYGICAGGIVNKSNANLDTLPIDEVETKQAEPGQSVLEPLGTDILVALDGTCDIQTKSTGILATATTGFPSIRGNFNLKQGCWYYEVQLMTDQCMQIGFADSGFVADSVGGQGVGDNVHSWAYDGWRQKKWNGDNTRYGGDIKWKSGDIIGCCVDCDHGEIRFYLNGNDLGVAFNGATFSGDNVYPAASLNGGADKQSVMFVFDAAHFKHSIPYGFDAINTCNYFTDTA